MAGSTISLRTRQIASIQQMINLNEPMDIMSGEPTWKLLVLDKYGQEIISPLLTLKQLREMGITLHLLIDSQREILPDVPAIYFISPTDKNIRTISLDIQKGLYDQYYLNMIYPISRPHLEEIANAAVDGNAPHQVQKVIDQYLSFITLEDDFFMLRKYSPDSPFSFHVINDPSTDSNKMENLIDKIVIGLFAMCVTLGVVPIIKCLKNNAAEHIARKLDQKIRDNLRDARNNLFLGDNIRSSQLSLHRPILVITDRIIDLSTMLHHTWTYQAMASDILDMELNRIRMKDKNGRQKEYEFSSEDKLWANYKGSPFPAVAEAIQEDLDNYRKTEDEIKRIKNTVSPEETPNGIAEFSFGDTTSKLTSAIGNLPELIERKRLIDQHTSIATALLDNIKERKLDILYENEEKLLNGQEIAIIDVLNGISDNNDALRLILIYACSHLISPTEKKNLLEFMEERAIQPGAFHFLQRLRSFTTLGHSTAEHHQGAGTRTINMFSKLLNHSSRFVMEGVKNLVPKKHNLPITTLVETLTDIRSNVAAGILSSNTLASGDYLAFDPKLVPNMQKDWIPTHPATDVIVFVVGGGSYVEYQNIVEYGKSKGLQRIIYGCTEAVSPKKFVEQLDLLGKLSN